MKKKYLLISLFMLASCAKAPSVDSTSVDEQSIPVSIEETSTSQPDVISTSSPESSETSTVTSSEEDLLVTLGGGEIHGEMLEGFTYIKGSFNNKTGDGSDYYGDGGLKLQYVGDGLLSNKFASKNHVEIKINIRNLNKKGIDSLDPSKLGTSDFTFSVYGLNDNNRVVAAAGVLKTAVIYKTDYDLVLNGPGITQIRFMYTSTPFDAQEEAYYNISLGGLLLKGDNSGSNEIINTEPVNPNNPEEKPEETIGKLEAPTNLYVDEETWTLHWDEVEHANEYRIYFNDLEVITEDNSRLLNEYVVFDGIVNTIKVQALDNNHKYESSDFNSIKYATSDLKGLFISEESYVKDLEIELDEQNNKVVHIPSYKLSKDSTGANPDVVLDCDYDFTNFRYTYESNSTIILAQKHDTKIDITFAQTGEFVVNVIKNGNKEYIYDSIKFVVENAFVQSDKFEVWISDYETIFKDSTYDYVTSGVEDTFWGNLIINTEEEITAEDITVEASISEFECFEANLYELEEGGQEYWQMYAYVYNSKYRGTFTITIVIGSLGAYMLTINVL